MSFRRLFLSAGVVPVLLAQLLLASPAAAKLDLYNPRKKYGDEKKAIVDPASRCTGPSFQAAMKAARSQAEKDLAARADAGGNVKAGIADAYETYTQELALAWGAMQEPYCGFGAFGTSAAQKSLKKTLDRARARFLAAVKAVPAGGSATVARTAATPSSTAADLPAKPTPAATNPVPVPANPALPRRTLKRGDRGTEVAALQAILVRKGYLSQEYATGLFGAQTEKAIIKLQKAKKIIKNARSVGAGQTGPRTRAALAK